MPPKFRSLEDVERWADDHLDAHRRERDQQRHEMSAAIDGAKAHIDRAIAGQNATLASIEAKVDAVGGLSAATIDELRLAREERIRRTAADEEKARIKKEAKDLAKAEELARTERNKRRAVWIPVILALLGIIGGLVTALATSHH